MKRVFIGFFIFYSSVACSQDVGAYIDYLGRLVIFEAGTARQIEKFNVTSVVTRGEFAVYITSTNLLKVFHKGVKYDLDENAYIDKYHVQLGFVVYKKGNILKLFDSRGRRPLSYSCSDYTVSDSMVLFKDDFAGRYMVYYDGTITEIPDLKDFDLGRSMLVFSDHSDNLYYLKNNVITEVPVRQPESMEVGSDIFSFVDISTNEFNVVLDDEIIKLLNIPPQHYGAGMGLVAYVEQSGNFSVFDKGKVIRLLNEVPESYIIQDRKVIFTSPTGLYLYQNGKIHWLEQVLPLNISVSSTYIAYEDQLGRLKAADDHGKVEFVSMEKVKTFTALNEMIYFLRGFNDHHFFYKGKTY